MSDLDRRTFFRCLAGAAAMAVMPIPIPLSPADDVWMTGPAWRHLPERDWRWCTRMAGIDISDFVVARNEMAKSVFQEKPL